MSKSLRRQKKDKLRHKKHKQDSLNKAARERYPRIAITGDDAPAEIINTFKRAMHQTFLGDNKVFSGKMRQFFKVQNTKSLREALLKFCGVPKEILSKVDEQNLNAILTYRYADLVSAFGSELLEYVPALRDNIPYVRFDLSPTGRLGRDWTISFQSLTSEDIEGVGKVFYSPEGHEVEVSGTTKRIAFTEQAVDEVCSSMFAGNDWKNYVTMADAHAIFRRCSYFEESTLVAEDGSASTALALFTPCIRKTPSWRVVTGVLEEDPPEDDESFYYYRTGYLTVNDVGKFFVADSFLHPGLESTPEGQAVSKSDLPHQEKLDMYDKAPDHTYELLKWYHDNGVPQIINSEEPLFDIQPPEQEAKAESQTPAPVEEVEEAVVTTE